MRVREPKRLAWRPVLSARLVRPDTGRMCRSTSPFALAERPRGLGGAMTKLVYSPRPRDGDALPVDEGYSEVVMSMSRDPSGTWVSMGEPKWMAHEYIPPGATSAAYAGAGPACAERGPRER